jgi:5-carboxymethyl-2-hydroxymuconate isomerase
VPHIVLRYSGNISQAIDLRGLFLALHERLSRVGDVSMSHFKSRAQRYEETVIGDGAAGRAFIHLDISLLTRPPDVRSAIADAALAVLTTRLSSALAGLTADVTVHVHDLDPNIYRKAVIAPQAAALRTV